MSSLCALSREITLKNEMNLNNNEFVTITLLPELKVQSEVNATVQFFKGSLSTRILSFIDYFRFVTQANYFITGLNTNAAIYFVTLRDIAGLYTFSNYHYSGVDDGVETNVTLCGAVDSPTPAAIYSSLSLNNFEFSRWTDPTQNSTLVKGFFIGCIPFESLLHTTLDCLYEIDCLQLLSKNFPSLNQVCFKIFYIHTILLA